MTDMHAHILPNIDDGARHLDESVEMARIAANDGIDHIICTPHAMKEFDLLIDDAQEQFDALQAALIEQGVHVQISMGFEVYASRRLVDYEHLEKLRLAGSNRLLFEMDFSQITEDLDEILYCIGLPGMVAVLAHPERYEYFYKKVSLLNSLKERGVELQVNASSILGVHGRKAQKMAKVLLKEHMVDYVGTDMHGVKNRGPFLSEAFESIAKWTSVQYAQELRENAAQLIQKGEGKKG